MRTTTSKLTVVLWATILLASLPALGAEDPAFLRWLVQGTPDPAAIAAHDQSGYYVFATGEGIAMYHSTDLKQWSRIGRVFKEDVPTWAKKLIPDSDAIWAPDIQFCNGQYYLYYSVSTMGSQRSVIGLAVNTTLDPQSPDYRWVDRGLVLESFPDRNDFNAIDPALLVDDNGRAYLYWGSYWTGIKATEVDATTGKPTTKPLDYVSLARRADAAPTSIEAPYVIKRNGFYYLFTSWGVCCAKEDSTYKILVGRSRSPLGPFIDDQGRSLQTGGGTLLLMGNGRWRGPGHNSILRTAGKDWLVYHVIDAKAPEDGRILQVRQLDWKDDWPVAGALSGATPAEEKASPLIGRWDHRVNDRDHYDIFFEPSGEISGTKEYALWEIDGDDLLMKWKNPQAPGGFWIDKAKMSATPQLSYVGGNQNGTRIQGQKRDSKANQR